MICRRVRETDWAFETGAVAGPKGCIVKIQDAVKKPWPDLPGLGQPFAETPAETLRATA